MAKKTQAVQIGSVQGIFYSINRGQGKTVALVSYYHPDQKDRMRRLIIDEEGRSRQYRAPNGKDDPEQLLFAFDYFHEVYALALDDGELTSKALVQLYEDIRDGLFPYDCLLVDNAAMFQDDIRLLILEGGKAAAVALAKAFRGVHAKYQTFLDYKFKLTDTVGIYGLVKAVIEELLRICQRRGVDVLVATEAKNVWQNYGTSNMKILGQTAKVLEPWMKYADFAYELSRTKGSREQGTAELIAIPWARTDTFNPKNSLPGLPPLFEMKWPSFWEHVLARKVTTDEEWKQVEVEKAESPELDGDPVQELQQAKEELLLAATRKGIIKGPSDGPGVQVLKELLKAHGLTSDDALAHKDECLGAVEAWKPPTLPKAPPKSIITEAE